MTDTDPKAPGSLQAPRTIHSTLDLESAVQQGQQRRVSLLIYSRDGARVVPLGPGMSVVIGRAAPADVCIQDPSLSRAHVRVANFQDAVLVEDLNSTNGTRVNGERVSLTRIQPGDEVSIGAVTVGVHVLAPGAAPPAQEGLDTHDQFAQQLRYEVLRARTLRRPLALLVIRTEDRAGGHVTRWYPTVRGLLGPIDRATLYGPGALEVLIPEATGDETTRLTQRLVGLRKDGLRLLCGVAFFPAHASSADELTGLARAAARRATPQEPICHAEASPPPSPSTSAPPEAAGAAPPLVQSPCMLEVFETVRRVGPTRVTVLLQGETGVGKEIVARAIHEAGPRRARPLRALNCATIPATLIESVLFGHERGAFTGADRRARGLFEEAHQGTVFLDEVAELSPAAQAALLRVLETRQLTRVGGHTPVDVDVRVIAATHRDLEALCAEGAFRQDLLYRLNTVTISIPPLRERVEEIAPLALRFLAEANAANDRQVREIDELALAALEAHAWPGNVRELRNAVERAVVICPGDVITSADLPERLRGAGPRRPQAPGDELLPEDDALADDEQAEAGPLRERVKDYEARLIRAALDATAGNQTEAARRLGIPRRTLVRKIRDHGLLSS